MDIYCTPSIVAWSFLGGLPTSSLSGIFVPRDKALVRIYNTIECSCISPGECHGNRVSVMKSCNSSTRVSFVASGRRFHFGTRSTFVVCAILIMAIPFLIAIKFFALSLCTRLSNYPAFRSSYTTNYIIRSIESCHCVCIVRQLIASAKKWRLKAAKENFLQDKGRSGWIIM